MRVWCDAPTEREREGDTHTHTQTQHTHTVVLIYSSKNPVILILAGNIRVHIGPVIFQSLAVILVINQCY